MTGFNERFGGGVASGGADGFPPFPEGDGIESTGSTRAIRISGSSDIIRIPEDPQGAGAPTLGYRRVDDTGSGGGSEWSIDWNAISTFTGWPIATLDDGSWHSSVIKNGKIYLGFNDNNANGGGEGSYICRADLTTGSIEAVTRIDETNLTVFAAGSERLLMEGANIQSCFWDITDAGNIRIMGRGSSSAKTRKGIPFAELQSDYSTVVSQTILFENDQDIAFDPTVSGTSTANYFTKDLSVFVFTDPTRDELFVLVPNHGVINLPFNDNSGLQSPFIVGVHNLLGELAFGERSASVSTSHHVNEDSVALRRRMTPDAPASSAAAPMYSARIQVSRDLIDQYLKSFVKAYCGVAI